MTVARTARRRRKQMRMGYTHMAKMGRPKYSSKIVRNMQAVGERKKK